MLWATRGRDWGFRFLLDGGFADPLAVYEKAFTGTEGADSVYRRVPTGVAVRFPDPSGRRDSAGRVIPHELIVPSSETLPGRSVEEVRQLVWPTLSAAYAQLWAAPAPPTPEDVDRALTNEGPGA